MAKGNQGRRALPTRGGHRLDAVRIVVVLTFAAVAATLLGSLGPKALSWLFSALATRFGGEAWPEITRKYPWYPVVSMIPFALLGGTLGGGIGLRLVRSFERMGASWDRMESGDKITLFA